MRKGMGFIARMAEAIRVSNFIASRMSLKSLASSYPVPRRLKRKANTRSAMRNGKRNF